MPLFFVLAGFVHKTKQEESIVNFSIKKYNSILGPYFLFSILSYCFWLLIGRNFGEDKLLNINIIKPFIGIFYANGHDHWMQHNLPLWFLPCLFVVELIFFIINNKTKNSIQKITLISTLTAIGFINSKTFNIPLPFSGNTAFVALSFFSFGYFLKERIASFSLPNYISLSFIIIAYFIAISNQRVDMQSNNYNNIILFYLSSLLNIIGYICIIKKTQKNSIIVFFGENTLLILAFHGIALSFIKAIQIFLFKIPLDYFNENIVASICYTILAFAILTPVILINKKFNLLSLTQIRLTKT